MTSRRGGPNTPTGRARTSPSKRTPPARDSLEGCAAVRDSTEVHGNDTLALSEGRPSGQMTDTLSSGVRTGGARNPFDLLSPPTASERLGDLLTREPTSDEEDGERRTRGSSNEDDVEGKDGAYLVCTISDIHTAV